MVIFVISGLAFITYGFPQQEKTQDYYLAKDLFSCSILFVVIPLIIVKKNQKMQNYFVVILKSNPYYSKLSQVLSRLVFKRKLTNNQVTSVSFIDLKFSRMA
jgi:hypothetical protein